VVSELALDNLFLMCENLEIRPATTSSQTQSSNRNEKDVQCYLEPGTPNISKYQPEMISLDMVCAKNMFLWRKTNKAPERQRVA